MISALASTEATQLLAHALHSIQDAVTIANHRDELIYVNPAFCRMYGYSEAEVIGQPSRILWGDPNGAKTAQILENTLDKGWTGELMNRRKDGSLFYIHLTANAVRDDKGRLLAMIGVARDISDRKTGEALQQSETAEIKAQAQFLEHVNDDFRRHLEYARNLQRAMMSSPEDLHRFFPECFVVHEAAGPLPSDFYWVSTYLDRIFVAIVDIHTEGMAGALLALLMQSLLVQAVHEDSRLQPDGMIELIQERLLRVIPDNTPETAFDGISLGVASISRNLRSCIYGGADMNAHVFRKGSFMVMEGIPQRLGLAEEPLADPPHVLGLSLYPGDVVYFYSRGAYDVRNAAGVPLGIERLHLLLEQVYHYPMERQQQLLTATLRDWRQGAPLESDVLLLAMRV